MVALTRNLFVVGACLLFIALFAAACTGKEGPAGSKGAAGAAGAAGAPGAPGPKGDLGPAGPMVGVVINPPEIIQGRVATLMGWGFKPGEAWVAYMDLSKDGPSAVMSGGEANAQGIIGAVGVATVGSEVNLVPAAVKPGFYIVTVEGSNGTKAYTTLNVLPAPTPTPRPVPTNTPAAPAATATPVATATRVP